MRSPDSADREAAIGVKQRTKETGPEPTTRAFAPDWWLFVAVLSLVTFGLIMVYDASYPLAIFKFRGDALFYFKRQALAALIGLGALGVCLKVPYWKLRVWALPALLVSFALLLLVFKFGGGPGGSHRWLRFGGQQFQPSEFAKLALVLFLAQRFAARPRLGGSLWTGFAPLAALVLSAALLVEREPDLGTASVLLVVGLVLLWLGGARTRWIAALLGVCLIGVLVKEFHHGPGNYRLQRILIFLNPAADPMDSGFQVSHSTLALGTGGVTGLGFGESREKWVGGLPEQRTDFIYAIVGEEFGLIGAGLVLLLYLIIVCRGFSIACHSRSTFGRLLAGGLTSMIGYQALLNIAVVTASVPATGVPLPFLSYGGTAMIVMLIASGLLLNVSMYPYYRDGRRALDLPREKSPGEVAFRKAGVL